MLPNFKEIFPKFSENSRIWFYLADRALNDTESTFVRSVIHEFTSNDWNAHGAKLTSAGTLVLNQLIILAVDENIKSASGCSIDSSVRIIKKIGQELNIDFFNRLHVLIFNEFEIKRVHIKDLRNFADWHLINPMVQNLKELRNNGMIEIQDSILFQTTR